MKVFVAEENFLGKAQMKYNLVEVDGRNGEEVIPLGYSNFNSTLSNVVAMGNLEQTLEWLNGKGTLEYMDRVTTIHFLDSYEIKKRNKPFTIPFIRSPFWYKKDDEFVTVTTSVTNEGTYQSQPIIRLERDLVDVVEIKIGGTTLEYDFNGEPYVEIDCVEMEAKYDGLLRNRKLKIGYEFPILQAGVNAIETTKGSSIIKFKRKDVWL